MGSPVIDSIISETVRFLNFGCTVATVRNDCASSLCA
jgi:hypothetical protein